MKKQWKKPVITQTILENQHKQFRDLAIERLARDELVAMGGQYDKRQDMYNSLLVKFDIRISRLEASLLKRYGLR